MNPAQDPLTPLRKAMFAAEAAENRAYRAWQRVRRTAPSQADKEAWDKYTAAAQASIEASEALEEAKTCAMRY